MHIIMHTSPSTANASAERLTTITAIWSLLFFISLLLMFVPFTIYKFWTFLLLSFYELYFKS